MNAFALFAVAIAELLPPPIIVPPGPNGSTTAMVSSITRFLPGEVRCDGATIAPVLREEPLPVGSRRPTTLPTGIASPPASIALEFRIDATGRPLTIRTADPPSPSYLLDMRDVVPAFAAWRFAPGAERRNCTVAFAVRSEPLGTAELSTLYRYLALQRPGLPGFSFPVGRAAFDRLRPAGSTCSDEPSVRLRAYPPFEEIPQAAGTRSHSFLAYDIDASGRPRNVRLLGSGGNAELDRASIAAIGDSRFAPEARTGCTYYYYRNLSEPMAAPATPEPATFKTADSDCPDDRNFAWSKLPDLSFPAEFAARNTEGWAVVRFDVAPWGEVGNVTVAAAEPAAAFGERAQSVVRAAKKNVSDRGYRGCVTRVVFKLPPS